MGEVYVARRTGAGAFEKRVALKLMLPHLKDSPEQLERFYSEARLAARMHHPNIVEVFDVGELLGRPFIAMQLVDGVTLERLIREAARQGTQMPLPVLNAVVSGLLEALEYAHTLTDETGAPLQIVHRDVTPGNVLVSRTGAVLLADFGIARVGGVRHTAPGVVRGKPAYLAPEQILENAPIDARTDLFSAAVTLYETATNHHPFRRQTDGATLHAVVSEVAPRATSVRPDVSEAFAVALERGLAQDPAHRFASARLLREQLVSGTIATASEVAAWVRTLCPEEPAATTPASTVTSTIAPPSPPRRTLDLGVAAPPPPRAASRTWVGLLGLSVAMVGLAVWVEWRTRASTLGVPVPPGSTIPQEAKASELGELVRREAKASESETLELPSPKEPPSSSPGAGELATPKEPPSQPGAGELATPKEPPSSQPGAGDRVPSKEPQASPPGGALATSKDLRSPQPRPSAPATPRDAAALAARSAAGGSASPNADEAAALKQTPVESRGPAAQGLQPGLDAATPVLVEGPRVEPVKAAAPKMGFLSADARPWADVLLGDDVIDRTPFIRYPLTVGDHTLTFRGPKGELVTRRVVVTENATTAVRVEFEE